MSSPLQPTRWWPLVVIFAVVSLALLAIWLTGDVIRQVRVIRTMIAIGVGLLAGLVWLGLASRLPLRRRLGWLAGIVGGLAVMASLVRIRGVSGDLVPIFEWRWSATDGAARSAVRGPTEPLPTRPPADASAATAGAAWPQFLGPSRNGTVTLPTPLATDWTTTAPVELWRRPVGAGWSSFAIQGDIAVTQEQDGADELVTAYDRWTGAPRWRHAEPARYATTLGGVGPRATPTIAGNRVFALGATGDLVSLDLATGQVLWRRDVETDHDATTPTWGRSGSPLVLGDQVVVSAGGSAGHSLVAYRVRDGAPVWAAGDDNAGYASPVELDLDGQRQIVIFNQASVAGHAVDDGRQLWSYPWSARQPNVMNPVPLGTGDLLVSSGYGVGAERLQLSATEDGWRVESRWQSRSLKCKFGNVIVHDGVIYGLDDGILTAVDPTTGERHWKNGRYGHGSLILAGDLLLVLTESGDLVLIDPSPRELRELATHHVLDGKTWNNPALVGDLIYVRNDREAACLRLPTTAAGSS